MKRRISDMMDGMYENTVALETESPLSSKRIKELTMKKVTTKKTSRRIFSKVLLAAALVTVLTVTATAAEQLTAGEWFRDIFQDKGKTENLDSQVAYVDAIGKVFQESMTNQGTTITPLAAYGDENICYLRLKVTGPEETVLPEDIHYAFYGTWDQAMTLLDDPQLYEGLWVLPDADPGDNEKEFLIKVMTMPDAGQKLNSGATISYHIYGLYEVLPYEEGKTEFKQLLPGEFTLDLSICNQVEQKDLDVDGVSYYREEIGIQHNLDDSEEEIPYNYTVTFSEMKLSPLSISWVCDYEMSDPTWKVGPEIQVFLKDGNEVPIQWGRGTGASEDHHFGFSLGNGFFDVPIALEDVDYVLLGGTHKIPVS